MIDKELQSLLNKIDNLETLDVLSDITKMMKDIIVEDKDMSEENKIRFLYLYIQHRQECNRNLKQKFNKGRRFSLKNMMKRMFM